MLVLAVVGGSGWLVGGGLRKRHLTTGDGSTTTETVVGKHARAMLVPTTSEAGRVVEKLHAPCAQQLGVLPSPGWFIRASTDCSWSLRRKPSMSAPAIDLSEFPIPLVTQRTTRSSRNAT